MVDAPLALYRRYRPESFAEVIGQEHVTEPLRAALANNRVNHAYLFSGPRGCGKTTSARILARSLNCAQAPVADPCGECLSCVELARGGSGSIDVIEIDAASHNGVDDARELRERAFFAPVRDRYKVYVIDEAHMITPQAFNALLKLVEEPPPHVRFIFATTDPDKVLPTIRSRTHHYPFRLIPPRLLSAYVAELCARESIAIEPAAIPLVVRAGAGSARDTLSVLDQLMGGAGEAGVTHQLATGLLGYTPEALLDEVVTAFAAGDSASAFGAVDRVIESGQDPQRFARDLLDRLRDLVIVKAVPEAPVTGLIDVTEDAGERLVAQANSFGAGELSRAADMVAAGLTEMRGAIAPRLLLELICARVLLPSADDTHAGLMARLDRLERRLAIPTAAGAEPAAPARTPRKAAASEAPPASAPAVPPPVPAAEAAPTAAKPAATPKPAPAAETATEAPGEAAAPVAQQPAASGAMSVSDVRQLWPTVVEATKGVRRLIWMTLSEHAQVVGVDGTQVTLGFNSEGARSSFVNNGGPDIVRQAALTAVGVDWRIEAIADPSAKPAGSPAAAAPVRASAPATKAADPAPAPPPQESEEATAAPSAPVEPPQWAAAPPTEAETAGVEPDDPMIDDSGLDSRALLAEALGAQVIDEITHD